MRSVTMKIVVSDMSPDEVYDRISRFEDYAKHTDTVRRVDITETSEDGSKSSWEIKFRDGIMRWDEEDRFFPQERRVRYEALGGDLDMFTGEWSIEAASEGTVVTFHSKFDLGLSTLNDMVEPIAEEALRETIDDILHGLTAGRSTVVEGQSPSAAAAAARG